jgi:polar amino acid transport system substrate-binding protein
MSLLSGILYTSAWAEIVLMTENYPPFSYTDKSGKATGFSTDIVMEIQKRLGYINPPIEVPWSRGYFAVQKKANHALYSAGKSKLRKNLMTPDGKHKVFKWVGPIAKVKSVFIGLRNREYNVTSVDNAREQGLKIGVIRRGYNEISYQQRNKKIDAYNANNPDQKIKRVLFESVIREEQNIKKLIQKKIDLIVGGDPTIFVHAKRIGALEKIKTVTHLGTGVLHIIFNYQTPDSEIEKWQKTLDLLKKDGFYQKKWDDYFGSNDPK